MGSDAGNVNLVITTTITIALAFLGYLITYLNNLRLSQRRDRLDRLNKQLGEFYGPLFALDHASYVARQKFLQKYAAGRDRFFVEGIEHSEDELWVWRHWMTTVFMPINMRIYELILSKSDLLIEPHMPSCLITLCAHVTSYKVVLEKWEKGDFTEHTALVGFPRELHDYTKVSFDLLKSEQAKLLGKSNNNVTKSKSKNITYN
jgi:hypothetical protein